MTKSCTIADCDAPYLASGYCRKHYNRNRRCGDALAEVRPWSRQVGPCSAAGCERPREKRGYCNTHYQRVRASGDPQADRPISRDGCSAPGCTRPHEARGYCIAHYGRLRKCGDPQVDLPVNWRTLESTHYRKVPAPGHPVARPDGTAYVHRVVLFDKIGPGAHPCHVCEKPVSWNNSYPRDSDALVVDHLDEDIQNNAPENLAPSCAVCNIKRSSYWIGRGRAAKATW